MEETGESITSLVFETPLMDPNCGDVYVDGGSSVLTVKGKVDVHIPKHSCDFRQRGSQEGLKCRRREPAVVLEPGCPKVNIIKMS